MRERLLIVCNGPGFLSDLTAIDLFQYDLCAVNRAGLELPQFEYWASLHAEDLDRWIRESGKTGFTPIIDYPFCRLPDAYIPRINIGLTGSSSLFAVVAGICLGYRKILIIGAPLTDESYIPYRRGWESMETILRGRQIQSTSGWTKTFLEKSCKSID